MAGYGRREVAHCITNDQGPEAFEVCSRPMDCSYDHRTRSCGVSFNYKVSIKIWLTLCAIRTCFPKGEQHSSCIRGPTPSKDANPVCSRFRREYVGPDTLKDVTIHLVGEDDKMVTCYPGNFDELSEQQR